MIAAIRPGCLNCGNLKTAGAARGLCQVCWRNLEVRAQYPCRQSGRPPRPDAKRLRAPCRHCKVKHVNRPLGLCYHCYNLPGVRALYPTTSKFHVRQDGSERDPRPERQPGEPPWRCVWCMAFRCDRPLEKCGECEREYAVMAVGMPDRTKDDD